MRAFMILALASMALARPEAGYSYQQPSVPSGSYGAPGGSFSGGQGGSSGGSLGGFVGGGHGSGSGIGVFGGGGHGGSGFSGAGGFGSGGFSGSGFGTGGGGGFGGGTLIQKHIYVHVPPPEPVEDRPVRVSPSAGPAQKHYKIIFIKAPTPPTPTAPVIPALPTQDEQKTLIYVLVKKPEEAPEFSLPTAAPTQPSKPEVYFIKYKTQKDGGSGGIASDSGIGGIGLGSGLGSGGLGSDGHGSGHGTSHGNGHGASGSIGGGSSGLSSSYGAPGPSGPY